MYDSNWLGAGRSSIAAMKVTKVVRFQTSHAAASELRMKMAEQEQDFKHCSGDQAVLLDTQQCRHTMHSHSLL